MTHTIHDSLPSGFDFADEHQTESFTRSGSIHGASKVCLVRADDHAVKAEADILQASGPDEFPRGYYEHLAVQNTARVACRLRPPRSLDDLESTLGLSAVETIEQYVLDYNAGWTAAGRKGEQAAWDSGNTPFSWDDGFLDRIAERPKWHTAYCENHTECPEGRPV